MSEVLIKQFADTQQAQECLEYWQDILNLNDWIIKLKINCTEEDFTLNDVCGENTFVFENMCAFIKILDPKLYGNRITKYCAEKILVHELLHCKYNFIELPYTYEGKYTDTLEHQLIEQMSNSLIRAKYGVPKYYLIDFYTSKVNE